MTIKLRHFEVLAAAGLLMVIVGCTDSGGSASQKIEHCDTPLDCPDDMRCVRNVCVEPNSGGDSDSDSDADAGSHMIDCDGGKLDPGTNLCWQNPPPESDYTWDAAVGYCDNLSLGGSDDWRLPNIQELISLLRGCIVNGEATRDLSRNTCGVTDPGCLDIGCLDSRCGGCDTGDGPGASGCYWDSVLSGKCSAFWSSSSEKYDKSYVWYMFFGGGEPYPVSKTSDYAVRCVRPGP